jgi:hypothetical protein
MAGKVAVFYRGRVRRCQREGITVSQTKGCPSIGLSPMRVKRKLVPGSELWDLVLAPSSGSQSGSWRATA